MENHSDRHGIIYKDIKDISCSLLSHHISEYIFHFSVFSPYSKMLLWSVGSCSSEIQGVRQWWSYWTGRDSDDKDQSLLQTTHIVFFLNIRVRCICSCGSDTYSHWYFHSWQIQLHFLYNLESMIGFKGFGVINQILNIYLKHLKRSYTGSCTKKKITS